MPRKYSPSQLRSLLRQAEQKQRQAINKYNQAVRQYNQGVRTAVNKYNQAVRAHNARVHAHRSRVRAELSRLRSQAASVRTTTYTTSVHHLYASYERLQACSEGEQFDPMYNRILDLSEREMANSLAVANGLAGSETLGSDEPEILEDAELRDKLRMFSPDLDDRWQGAVFALSPRNPDASRHFCTSAREIITQMLELRAPDGEVLRFTPDCDKTEHGKPTRRSKVKHLLSQRGLTETTLADFVESDIENIVQLFRVLNDGTHGSSGAFSLGQLSGIRKRVEQGINFLAEICGA